MVHVLNPKTKMLQKFVDDSHATEQLLVFLDFINHRDATIQYTVELEIGKQNPAVKFPRKHR